MKRIVLSIFALALVLSFAVPCYCITESTQNQSFTVNGNVTDVDSVGGTIVVRTVDASVLSSGDEIKFSLADDAKITKGDETIDLEDIDVNDSVTIDYYKDSSDNIRAVRIIDNNAASDY